jgi:hypothetical protein
MGADAGDKTMKSWYKCKCGTKLAMIDDTKNIEGVYVKCKCCKREVEIVNIVESRKPESRIHMRSETSVQSRLVCT